HFRIVVAGREWPRQLDETVERHRTDVFAVDPRELGDIEAGVVAEYLRQIEQLHYVVDRHDFPVVFRRPAEQTEIVAHGFRHVAVVYVRLQRGQPRLRG